MKEYSLSNLYGLSIYRIDVRVRCLHSSYNITGKLSYKTMTEIVDLDKTKLRKERLEDELF